MFKDKIREYVDNNEFVCIYTNNTDGKFSFGNIIASDDENILIASYSIDGEYDGLIFKEIASTFKLEVNNKYIEKMKKLIDYKDKKHERYIFTKDLKKSIIEFSAKGEFILSIELLNSEYDDAIGYVYSINEEYCTIKSINEYGYDDGYTDVQYTDITRIVCNSSDEARRKILHKINYSKI